VNQTAISLASVVGQRPEISDQRSAVRGTASPNALRDSAHSTGQPYKRAGPSGVSERRIDCRAA